MKTLYTKALQAYIEMLEIHIDTKTTDIVFHQTTEKFYETLFDIAHSIWEKHVDLWGTLRTDTLEDKKQKAYDIITNLKKELEDYKRNHEISLGTEDLLGSLANDLEDIQGTSKAFLRK